MRREEILKYLASEAKNVESKGVEIVGLFGSFARNEATDSSDVDILIRLKPSLIENEDPFNVIAKLQSIRKHLSERLGRKVDLADIDALNKVGKKYILQEICYVEK